MSAAPLGGRSGAENKTGNLDRSNTSSPPRASQASQSQERTSQGEIARRTVQQGRAFWHPHAEIEALRARIEALEIAAEIDAQERALTMEALRTALALANAHEKRLRELECFHTPKDERA